MKQWRCLICDFIYNEELGFPKGDIPAGTLWRDVPNTWKCPDCEVGKEDFELLNN